VSRIGKLRHRVTIQEETRVDDGMGGFAKTWADVATVWARVSPLSGREVLQAQQLSQRVTHKVEMRERTIDEGNRLLYGTRGLNIRVVRNVGERDRHTEIMAEEGAAT
jgi:SPP1 family predicted phage head-tail adaptor